MPDYEKEYGHPYKKNFDFATDYPNAYKHKPIEGFQDFAFITLITRPSYLAGVIVLAHTLAKSRSKFPIVVLYTPTIGEEALEALHEEAIDGGYIILQETRFLLPPQNDADKPIEVAAERFEDTWTKLRVFGTQQLGFKALCYLDADMVVLKNPDDIFLHIDSFFWTHIMAVQDCVCSPDKQPWTPETHTKDNCAFTPLTHPDALFSTVKLTAESPPTHRLFNTGMMLFQPRDEVWAAMIDYFLHTDKLSSFHFPDQDFITYYFRNNRIHPLPWKYNAVKTMAYRHQNVFRLEEAVILHYIVDKPWARRVGADGVAGFKGQDGETHKLWWQLYEQWVRFFFPFSFFLPCQSFRTPLTIFLQVAERTGKKQFLAVSLVAKHVAPAEGDVLGDRPDMAAIGPLAK